MSEQPLSLRIAGALLALGSVRNVLPAANAATEVTNVLLPAVMLWLGLAWVRPGPALRRAVPAALFGLGLAFAPESRAEALPRRELIVNGFRAPSTGIELRDGWLSYHLGFYPTTIDTNVDGAPRTTWFLKVGLLAYPLQFDTGSGRPSSPYIGLSLVQGLNHDWDVTRDAGSGSGGLAEVGFRWAAYRGLDIRLGAALLAGFDGRIKLNPTPGIGWAIPF